MPPTVYMAGCLHNRGSKAAYGCCGSVYYIGCARARCQYDTNNKERPFGMGLYMYIYADLPYYGRYMVREGIQTPVGNVCTHIVASNGSKILHFDVHRYDDVLDYCTFL